MKPEDHRPAASRQRIRYRINGIVQGVGFRPFVFRLAESLRLAGHVGNNSNGVVIEVEGSPADLGTFQHKLLSDLPAVARITRCDQEAIPPAGDHRFQILSSEQLADTTAFISPDIAICDDCLHELCDPSDRRHRYPFINCTNCGPRYTIVERIPYDRPNTSMRHFPMCPDCRREYDNPANRRFHAQPNACPVCGPKVSLWGKEGEIPANDPIRDAISLLSKGKILAIRGLGGFHLAVDPRNEPAVAELRRRKGRAEKPFALMARDIDTIRRFCAISPLEAAALMNRTRPIVLLRKSGSEPLPDMVAPGQHSLGFMLPYTPLHHLLLAGQLDLLVMTSGNYSEEPIAINNAEAQDRLSQLADYFLLHDREILQRCDDSIVRVMHQAPRMLRRSRGFVPEPLFLRQPTLKRILAVGGELKNTIALSRGDAVFLSQHIGDLDNPSAYRSFRESISHLGAILELTPEVVACDLHPEYLSTKWAVEETGLPVIRVQHHHAHLAAVLAESGNDEPAIGIILDGTGYGTDGTIWGGELLVGNSETYERFAWLEPTPMPGGEVAIRQPWRMGLSYLDAALGPEFPVGGILTQVNPGDLETAEKLIERKINTPLTSSCGRLFDGVAAILGLRREVTFEAQAAMELEAVSAPLARTQGYPQVLESAASDPKIPIAPLVRAIVHDRQMGKSVPEIAASFHVTLAEMFISRANLAREAHTINRVALSGGVWQNLLFFEYVCRRLEEERFTLLTHSLVPTNDGGLALGQVAVADSAIRSGKVS